MWLSAMTEIATVIAWNAIAVGQLAIAVGRPPMGLGQPTVGPAPAPVHALAPAPPCWA